MALTGTDALSLAAVLGLVLLVYAQLWLPGLVLIKRDAFQLFLPLKQYITDRLSHGELPQWFPYEGLGRPLISLTVMGVFHPFTALYWFFPVQDAYRISTLLCCLMATAGTFFLVRSLGISCLGAAVGSLGFVCSGYVMSLTENVLYLYSICALPLFLSVLDQACRTGRNAWLAAAGLVWASVLLNGDIQTAYYLGFVALLWAMIRTSGRRRVGLGRLAVVASLAVLVAAIQLAPAWVGYQHSDRAGASSFHAEAIHWSTHPLRLMTLLVSPIDDGSLGDQMADALFRTQSQSRGPSGLWAESLYVGPVLIGLAILACLRRRDMRVFAVLGVTTLVLAMGSYGGLYEILYEWMPLWSAFRYPEKLMGFATFALAMLAASGIDVLERNRREAFAWAAGACVLALAGLILTRSGPRLLSDATGVAHDLALHIVQSSGHSAWFAAAATAAMAGLLEWLRRRPLERAWVGSALVLLLTLDLARANLPAIHTSSSEAWTFTPGLASAVVNDAHVTGPGHFRILSIKDSIANVSKAVEKGLTSRERIAALRRHGLYLEHNAVFHIESIQHYLAGINPRVDQVGKNGSTRVAARYNVAYFIGRPSSFQTDTFAGSTVATVPAYDLALVRNPAPVTPRAYLSKRPEPMSDLSPILSLLQRDEFLRGEVDGIETSDVSLPEATTPEGDATIVDYQPETVRVNVHTPQAAILVLADAYEPGWTARIVGGDRLQILRANGLVRAVLVPPGHSQILFEYESPGLRLGAWCSGLGLCLVALLIMFPRKQLSVSNRFFLYQN
jgi:hypothetical protein